MATECALFMDGESCALIGAGGISGFFKILA